jgi:hypothetical protein
MAPPLFAPKADAFRLGEQSGSRTIRQGENPLLAAAFAGFCLSAAVWGVWSRSANHRALKMQPALTFQFERAVNEYACWQAVPVDQRSDAPAWWWSTAMAAIDETATMPVEWCATLGVADESTYAKGAEVFRNALAGQTYLPWPEHFPRKSKATDAV